MAQYWPFIGFLPSLAVTRLGGRSLWLSLGQLWRFEGNVHHLDHADRADKDARSIYGRSLRLLSFGIVALAAGRPVLSWWRARKAPHAL